MSEKLSEPKVLISEKRIAERISELAQEIRADYAEKEIVAICILKGAFVFYSDILRHLDLPVKCEFMAVSSYGDNRVSSGEVKLTLDIHDPLQDKHVMIFEDIVDSGGTLQYLINVIRARKPASIKTCTLLLKPTSLRHEVSLDYVGFRIGPEFVVGYGMDDAGKYRGVPYIGYLEPEH